MKKFLLTLMIGLLASFNVLLASGEEGVSQKAIASFNKDFSQAKEVSWEVTKEFYKATFQLDSQVLFAFYSEKGELLAVSRNIKSSQLPIQLSADLKNQYSKFWISDLFELASGNSTAYYVTIENADQKLVLRSTSTNGWETYKKEKKEII